MKREKKFPVYPRRAFPAAWTAMLHFMHIVFLKETDKLEFARRAGGQVVRQICVVVFSLLIAV